MRQFFRQAYASGQHGWPTEEPTAQVLEFVEEARCRGLEGPVLDLGCGEGRHAIACAARGREVVGLDYEPLAIERARQFASRQRLPGPLWWVVAEAFWLPFARESFSMVVDFGLFHHIKLPDQGRYIAEVRRVLIPGGALILSVFSTRFRHYPGEVRRRPWLVHRGHYDRFFTQADIRRLFEPAFSVARLVEEVEGLEAYHHALLFKEAA